MFDDCELKHNYFRVAHSIEQELEQTLHWAHGVSLSLTRRRGKQCAHGAHSEKHFAKSF